MNSVINPIKTFFEKQAFGVCAKLGDKLGFSSSSIRMFFIYASFITLGSPILIYLSLYFIINLRQHLRRNRSTVWEI
ncbi:MAG: PspC family transcriptional regulator [Bacteroidetes bacterium RIFCSPLOWO2_02_FULL_36_8]|nr:MAG: PspC family transcriptional regulator [Bacteroidetes bacterium RIFCSPLOWO2_02_FULL_36_8]OFY69023.1 MAG: PspC family transcriptional regulator [Bacteroidetes bacterium RIFCSPLOWO2_12_FULL_37_12]